jgi:tRNA threonylcarbamoyladenosine biosynthesis protein TsaB
MTVLAIDTTLNACQAALWGPEGLIAVQSEPMQRGQAERLAPLVAELLADAGVRPGDLTRVAVTTGPGSFTGTRVGLAFARGLALALKLPCVGVSTLEVLALAGGHEGLRAAVVQTPGALYLAAYADGIAVLEPMGAEAPGAAALLVKAFGGRPAILRGPGAAALAALVPGCIAAGGGAGPDVAELARLGATIADPGTAPPHPTYLRDPDAKLPAPP